MRPIDLGHCQAAPDGGDTRLHIIDDLPIGESQNHIPFAFEPALALRVPKRHLLQALVNAAMRRRRLLARAVDATRGVGFSKAIGASNQGPAPTETFHVRSGHITTQPSSIEEEG